MQVNGRPRVRSVRSDRMGFAWEPDELPDMTAAEAKKIIDDDAEARAEGQIGNEDPRTIRHANLLVNAAGEA